MQANVIKWREAPGGIFDDARDVGGDWQCGRSFSVRFIRDDKPGSLVTVYSYPIQHSPGDTCVPHTQACMDSRIETEQQVEYLTCTDPSDPGGTETWSECEYGKPAARSPFASLAEAEEEARRETAFWTPADVWWDGEPFHHPDDRRGD